MIDDCYDACVKGMPDLIQYAELKATETEKIDTKQEAEETTAAGFDCHYSDQ